jgi:DNA-binding MarR family transcriptional regulator
MLFVDRSNAGRALKSLEHEGYIERFQSDTDKRTNLVQITARGREAVTEISKLKEKMVQNFFGELNEAEAGQIIDLLRKVYPNEQDA